MKLVAAFEPETTTPAAGVDLRSFTIQVAGLKIALDTPSSRTYGYCIKYLTNGIPDICISINQDDIRREVEGCIRIGQVPNPLWTEVNAVYRKISDAVLSYDAFLMHGAVVAIDNDAFMFSAPSGTGKTTHVLKWVREIPDAYILNGDKPLIRFFEGVPYACGTPWGGKESYSVNSMVPLRAIVLMERAENENNMEEVSFSDAYPRLLSQTYIPKDLDKARKALNLLVNLSDSVRTYHFLFDNMRDDCLVTAYECLMRH